MNRVVVAGLGPPRDCEDEPLQALASGLRNEGSEVVFAGWDQTPAQVVTAALQEDVGAIGLCGATAAAVADIRGRLAEEKAADITVFTADSVTSPTSADRGQPDEPAPR
ncbi:MAG: hypothetical protein ABI251_13640 [Mycobacteriaceae bacterium]